MVRTTTYLQRGILLAGTAGEWKLPPTIASQSWCPPSGGTIVCRNFCQPGRPTAVACESFACLRIRNWMLIPYGFHKGFVRKSRSLLVNRNHIEWLQWTQNWLMSAGTWVGGFVCQRKHSQCQFICGELSCQRSRELVQLQPVGIFVIMNSLQVNSHKRQSLSVESPISKCFAQTLKCNYLKTWDS